LRHNDDDDDSTDGQTDSDLAANRFGLDDDDRDHADDELAADQHAEKVARLWDTPRGEWWP
jgi:hypothetical protein